MYCRGMIFRKQSVKGKKLVNNDVSYLPNYEAIHVRFCFSLTRWSRPFRHTFLISFRQIDCSLSFGDLTTQKTRCSPYTGIMLCLTNSESESETGNCNDDIGYAIRALVLSGRRIHPTPSVLPVAPSHITNAKHENRK